MAMEINLFQAGKGDCILVRCGTGIKKVNILIDSGIKKDYFLKALHRITENEENSKKSVGRDFYSMGRMSEEPYKNLFAGLTDDRILFNFGETGQKPCWVFRMQNIRYRIVLKRVLQKKGCYR